MCGTCGHYSVFPYIYVSARESLKVLADDWLNAKEQLFDVERY